MTPEQAKAQEKAIEALIGASLRAPDRETEITDEEIERYVEQHVTLSSEDKAALEKSKPDLMRTIGTILRGKEQIEANVTAKHTKGIFYRRAAFDAYIVHTLVGDENLGRTKIEKITHLTEYHCSIDFEREPRRDAAGPVDYQSRRKVESLATKQRWYSVVDAKNRMGKEYKPGPKIEAALPIAIRVMGSRKNAVDALIELLRPLDTKTCEVVATLYAAWNDLLLRAEKTADEDILRESRENWHPSKLTIPTDRWSRALAWMRDNHLIPAGTGKRVRPA